MLIFTALLTLDSDGDDSELLVLAMMEVLGSMFVPVTVVIFTARSAPDFD